MSVVQTTVNELLNRVNFVKGIENSSLKTRIDYATRQLFILQKHLQTLKSAEMLVLQRINRLIKMEEIEASMGADRCQRVDPLHSIRAEPLRPQDPDARINWVSRRLEQGMEPFTDELEKIGEEIKKTNKQMAEHQAAIENINAMLTEKGNQAMTAIAYENIAKLKYSEVLMLKQISDEYRSVTRDSQGVPQYSTNPLVVKKYGILIRNFKAFAERNASYLDGQLKLNLDDPGANENQTALKAEIAILKSAFSYEVSGVSKKVDKYSQRMRAHLLDPYISQGISRQKDLSRVPGVDEALALANSSVQGVADKINTFLSQNAVVYMIDSGIQSMEDALKKNFFKEVSAVNGGKPFCATEKSEQDKKDEEKKKAQAVIDSEAAGLFVQQYKKGIPKEDSTAVCQQAETLIKAVDGVAMGGQSSTIPTVYLTVGEQVYSVTNTLQLKVKTLADNASLYLQDMYSSNQLSPAKYNQYIASLQLTVSGKGLNTYSGLSTSDDSATV